MQTSLSAQAGTDKGNFQLLLAADGYAIVGGVAASQKAARAGAQRTVALARENGQDSLFNRVGGSLPLERLHFDIFVCTIIILLLLLIIALREEIETLRRRVIDSEDAAGRGRREADEHARVRGSMAQRLAREAEERAIWEQLAAENEAKALEIGGKIPAID
jgi:hypothetical protein